MLRRTIYTIICLMVFSAGVSAQEFKKLPSGLMYHFIKDVPGTKKASLGSRVSIHIVTQVGDQELYNSAKLNNGEPVPAEISAPLFNGDVMEGLTLMTEGDIADFKIPADSVYRNPSQRPANVKSGDFMTFHVEMLSIKTPVEIQKENQERLVVETKQIESYLNDQKLDWKKTTAGTYYVIKKKGMGRKPNPGDHLTVNYTGRLIDGTVFDSNTDSAFNHVQPFTFPVGTSNVIKGWDDVLMQFEQGTSGMLVIPSSLAYGNRAQGKIPENSILIFDVGVLKVQTPEEVDKERRELEAKKKVEQELALKNEETVIDQYVQSKNLRVMKTESGLRYLVTEKGNGPNVQVGNKVSMKYTGYLLDGTVFDSNVDPKFGHPQPFEFDFGQGRVIKGWDEGIGYLNKGSKAKLIIPSRMAYGPKSIPGNNTNPKGIPANSVLVFDVEVLEIK